MRKYILLAMFVGLAWAANIYFRTGEFPFVDTAGMPLAERQVRDLRHRFADLVDRYELGGDTSSDAFGEPTSGPVWALREVVKIEQELAAIRPELTTEYGRAEAGWLQMKIRKFKKRPEVLETDGS